MVRAGDTAGAVQNEQKENELESMAIDARSIFAMLEERSV